MSKGELGARDKVAESVRRAIREAIRRNLQPGDAAAAIESHLAAQFGSTPAATGASFPIEAGFKEAYIAKHPPAGGVDWSWEDATDISKPVREAYAEFRTSTDPVQFDVARSIDDRAILECRLSLARHGGLLVTCLEAAPQRDDDGDGDFYGCHSPAELAELIATLRTAAPTEALELVDLVVPYDGFWQHPIVTALAADGFQISRRAIVPARSNGAGTRPKGQVFSALKVYYYIVMQRHQPTPTAAVAEPSAERSIVPLHPLPEPLTHSDDAPLMPAHEGLPDERNSAAAIHGPDSDIANEGQRFAGD